METQNMENMKGRKTKQHVEKLKGEFQVISWRRTTTEEFFERMKYYSRNEAACSSRAMNLIEDFGDEKQ
jgi:hypothetical protein